MNILIGSLRQETNTFNPIQTTIRDFVCVFGKDMINHVNVIDIFKDSGANIIPTLYCTAQSGGPVSKNDFLYFEKKILDVVKKENIEGIWLYLHGAMFVESIGSGETHLLKEIRKIIGNDVPVAISLDFHANNTDEIINLANIICGYRTAPHRDMIQTERKAAKLLIECIKKNILPKPKLARANVLMPGDMVLTDNEPLKSIFKYADEVEHKPGFLCSEVFNGQPWVDTSYTGPSMIVIHDSKPELAQKEAEKLARLFYEKRHEFKFTIDAVDAIEAIEIAKRTNEKLVFISDSGDNPTAGGVGDNAYMLNRIIENDVKNVLIGGIMDYKAVKKCFSANIGNKLELEIGALLDKRSEKTKINCKLIHKGKILGRFGENAGRAAVIISDSITIIITETRVAFIKPAIFDSIGVDINNYKIIIVKLGYLFPDLAKIASKTILALTPGASTELLENLEYKKIRRPIYPFDDNFN